MGNAVGVFADPGPEGKTQGVLQVFGRKGFNPRDHKGIAISSGYNV
jgi:hypothetical protein